MALPQFSFPLDWRCNGLDFFFRGDKLGTGASVRLYDRAFSLVQSVPRGSVRTDAWSGASACVYAFSLVPRGCIRMGGFVSGAILLMVGVTKSESPLFLREQKFKKGTQPRFS
jgi:hypothetical protein